MNAEVEINSQASYSNKMFFTYPLQVPQVHGIFSRSSVSLKHSLQWLQLQYRLD